jgi:MFS family permease
MYEPFERGTKLGIFYAAPILGPSLGPILGGLLTQACLVLVIGSGHWR